MIELLIAVPALVFSLLVVLIIHWQVSRHMHIQSASSKAILAMDGVAIAVLFAGFILGEVSKFAETVRNESSVHFMALNWHDVALVLGTLFASLLIYVAIEKLHE